MIIGMSPNLNKLKNTQIKHNETVLDRVQTNKYLGFMLDEKLSFSDHINYTKTKAIPRLRMLDKYRHVMNRSTKLTLYKTLIAHYSIMQI